MDDAISLTTFLREACRPLDGMKQVTLLFDVQLPVPEFAPVHSCDQVNNLPACIRPPQSLPEGCRLGLVIRNLEDGTFEVVKILHFEQAISTKEALKLCSGQAYAPAFRPGPWALKKALVSLIDKLPGYHVSWFALTSKPSTIRRSQTATWAPDDEDLLAGIQYINDNAPDCDAQNQQYYWILCNIKDNSNTPISGWPKAKVRTMAQNKAKGKDGAPLEHDFPLHTFSLKPFFAKTLLPILYPLMVNYAFMLLGWPGVGKTPAAIVMMLAMGRYHQRRLGLLTPPGWRRAKSLDNFRHRLGQVHEGVFLDDPNREKIDLADLKSFVTAEENQTCHGRYNDVKLAKNCCRVYATNDVQKEDEPEPDNRISIDNAEFLGLLKRTFPGDKPADVMAVLKRTVVFIFGLHALYLRLPSQSADEPIYRINVDDLRKDLLAEMDKEFYGNYKSGFSTKAPDFDEKVSEEQAMIEASMTKYLQCVQPAEYVKHARDAVEEALLRNRRFPEMWTAPENSPSSPEEAVAAPLIPVPVPRPANAPRRRPTFKYPSPQKRFRKKASQEGVQSEEQVVHGPQPAAALPEDEDFAADEEAAADLGLKD